MSGPHRIRIALAQNLFASPEPAAKLVDLASLEPGDLVYELGAGTGMVTDKLVRTGARVVAIERDPNFVARLRRRFCASVTVIEGDLLAVRFRPPFKVVANLPYNMTAATLRRLLFEAPHPDEAVVVLQREAAEKYAGIRHTAIALRVKPWFSAEIVHCFGRNDFVPAPNVDSVVLCIRRRQFPAIDPHERRRWEAFVTYAFHRSKASARLTFRNLLSNLQWRLLAADLGIAPDGPLSGLSFRQWLGIYQFVHRAVPTHKRRLVLPMQAT